MDLVTIFVSMRLQTPQDPSQTPLFDPAKKIKALSVGVPAIWESFRESIVAKVNLGSPFTKAIFNGAMYVHPRFLRSSQIVEFVEIELFDMARDP